MPTYHVDGMYETFDDAPHINTVKNIEYRIAWHMVGKAGNQVEMCILRSLDVRKSTAPDMVSIRRKMFVRNEETVEDFVPDLVEYYKTILEGYILGFSDGAENVKRAMRELFDVAKV